MEALINQIEKKNIDSLCEKYNIENYTINEHGSIDVDGDVNLFSLGLTQLPLKFNKVTGNFDCGSNDLTSLEGCPKDVVGNFDCQDNKLTSLEHSPSKIAGHFNCNDNQLSSLEYCTDKVGGSYYYCKNDFPKTFIDAITSLRIEEQNIFFKYQNQLGVWYNGYDHEEAKVLIEEIKDGLL